ncbi:HIT family protein [Aquibacillus sp. 3ASR75-11]|uniref:HIT family protein n=1 Tax=Terrihalobacillus insolitus TaxID=2950438 RepID=A0A9X3WX08_9BACI|nr:HIT family protein [Terrihalobacillus insolitus]MDC3413122.1 HIT family protein [Terrihalobacillus insolitus]MDC3424864.1 HIT family protein [Terrihalobacillus insolitus]
MTCPFCNQDELKIELENEAAVAFYDKYPVQQGHLLIIPKAHAETYFDASTIQIMAIHDLIHQGKKLIDDQYAPDGYNIGVNVGEFGGQTVNHLHVHLIPRYEGDMEDPHGGIRNAIPNLVPYPSIVENEENSRVISGYEGIYEVISTGRKISLKNQKALARCND